MLKTALDDVGLLQRVAAPLIVALTISGCADSASPADVAVVTTTTVASPAMTGEFGNTDTVSAPAFVVDQLPEDFPAQPLFLCVYPTGVDHEATSLTGYRGTVHVDSDVYQETPFLRLSAIPGDIPLDDTSFRDYSNPRQRASERLVMVNGADAIAYTISTAEPVLTPWPAIRWQQDGATLVMLGEGLDPAQVLAAAESVRIATAGEREAGGFLTDDLCE